jgi:hypothetical protein
MAADDTLAYDVFVSDPIPLIVPGRISNGERHMFSPLATTLIYRQERCRARRGAVDDRPGQSGRRLDRGLVPSEYSSGNTVHRGHITRRATPTCAPSWSNPHGSTSTGPASGPPSPGVTRVCPDHGGTVLAQA